MRSKRAVLNFTAAIVELVVATVASFVVPHYIIYAYGSNANGLISSITQFLSYIALIESGIGAIGRASLYKPLAEGDTTVLSRNTKAIENFYRKIAYIFLLYVAVLAILFPLLVNKDFSWAYTSSLVIILAFSTFIQYYFGITSQTLIQADQKKYIPSVLQALTLFINMIITVLMVKLNFSVHSVKIGSTIAYAIRPMILYWYVRNHYKIDRAAKPRNEILKQRWDGLAQHIAFFIHKNTDIAVLTVLANVKEVSVYSVYMLAVSGCSKVVNIFSSSLEPAFGNMIAQGEKQNLMKRVNLCTIITIQVSVILFSTAMIVITPFINLYTSGVTDVEYIRTEFGVVMIVAEALYCTRLPYQYAIYAAGHFKQTRNGAVAEATINILISVILVFKFGLIGVACGTLVSMLYRTIQFIWYYHVKLLQNCAGLKIEIKKFIILLFEISVIVIIAYFLPTASDKSYCKWILSSFLIGLVISCFVLATSFIFFKEQAVELISFIKRLIVRKSKNNH